MLLHLYRRRLRAHPVSEALALAGASVGVALVFGVLLANTGLTGSARKLVHSLTGAARYELTSSDPQGFSERVVATVGRLPGVEVAAPVLRSNVTLTGPGGVQAVQLIGVSPSVEGLGGLGSQELAAGTQLLKGGIGLPTGVAQAIGARRHSSIALAAGGEVHEVEVQSVLGGALGALGSSPAAVAVLPSAQRLAGLPHTVTQLLVRPLPHKRALVKRELAALAGSSLQVRPADAELKLLALATEPNRQSTSLFTAIAVMIGFLLALNAVLLTAPERRRFVAELRIQGYSPAQVGLLLGFQALMLGLAAALVGVGLGYLLAHALFQRVPEFLSAAFPIGAEEVVHPVIVLAALACGVLAATIASLLPLLPHAPIRKAGARLLRFPAESRPARAGGSALQERRELLSSSTFAKLGAAAALLVLLAVIVSLAAPKLTILGGVALAGAAICCAPLFLFALCKLLPKALSSVRSPALIVALSELKAITLRGVALGGIVALAVYGGIAIGGARSDLMHGIEAATVQYFRTADVWVTAGKDVFNMNSFAPRAPAAALSRLPQVASVRVYRGGLLDVGDRRMWVRARPVHDSAMLEASQLLHGNLARAEARIRRGGWAAISSTFASEERLRIGGAFSLPTPSGPLSLRVAAILTNSGWPPGTISLSSKQYTRAWSAAAGAALEIDFKQHLSAAEGRRIVTGALKRFPGLQARTAAQREALSERSAKQGLRTLGEISTLLLLAAALAVASALGATIWQRRLRLAALKVQGYGRLQLWGAVLVESAVTIFAGALTGAALGIAGHALASRFLQLSTGFPAPFSLRAGEVTLTIALFLVISVAVIALPGALAARVSPKLALQE